MGSNDWSPLTSVEEASDILHDRVKIPVSLDFQTLVELMNDADRYSTTFLIILFSYKFLPSK